MTSMHLIDRRVFAAVAILAAACGSEPAQPTAVETVAAPVEIVRSATFADTRITTGTVRSSTVSPVAAKVMGNVTRVLVAEGQHVRRGDLLVEIDDREARAKTQEAGGGAAEVDQAIAAAQANADVMAATYKRFSALRERGSVSPQEFDEVAAKNTAAQAQLQQAIARRTQAEAGVAAASTFLSYSSVRSPIDGVVTARMIDPGAQAAPGMPLVTVEDDAHYRVETTIDEDLAARVRTGDLVRIDDRIAARVANIATVDAATRSAIVKVELPRGSGLRSGAFVRVAFTVGARNGITVPASAISRHGQLTSVFVLDPHDTARLRLVTLGDAHEGRIEVLSGVDAGETVVTQINNDLRDGVRVRS